MIKNQPTNQITMERLFLYFKNAQDVIMKEIKTTTGINYMIIYCRGLCDTERIDNEILPELEMALHCIKKEDLLEADLTKYLPKRSLQKCTNENDLMKQIFAGQLGIYIEDKNQTVYLIDLANPPKRTPEESNSEISIRGPRDGFIEDISTNAALIRKRLRTPSLYYEEFEIGKRSVTKVGLFYVYDIIKPEIITEIKHKLKQINIDGLNSGGQLEELLTEGKFNLFPIFQYTGRPDFAVDALLRGRFVIIIDGDPSVLIAPCTLSLLLKTAEDENNIFLFVSLERILRFGGFMIALFLPGFWVALISFHQNQIPFILLASLAQVRQGVPLPTYLESIVMLIIFELFHEAGSRLPSAIGQILSVVGGLIIGDAAIRAGLTSPAMVVVIATSAVATFSLVNQSLSGTISVLRIYVLLASSILGMFGFFVSAFSILLYLANLRTFGLPYLSPISPISMKDLPTTFFRPFWKSNKKRSKMLSINDNRQGE